MTTVLKQQIFSEDLLNDIKEAFGEGSDGGSFSLIHRTALQQSPRLIDKLRELAEKRWSANQIRKHQKGWPTAQILTMIEASERAGVLLIDAQRAYYDFCAREYGECPEPDCTRPLLLVEVDGRSGYRKCPWHSSHYHITYDGGGHVKKKERNPEGMNEF